MFFHVKVAGLGLVGLDCVEETEFFWGLCGFVVVDEQCLNRYLRAKGHDLR